MINPMIEFIMSFEEADTEDKYVKLGQNKAMRMMTGAGILNILSKTCSFMDDDKCYLEIGTHRGSTLIGAGFENEGKLFYGVDNFAGHNSAKEVAPFASIEEALKHSLKEISHDGVSYFKDDYRKFLQGRKDVDGKKVEVYLYDGPHEMVHQYIGMKLGTELLSDRAIVFVDDSANNDGPAVWAAINKLLKEDSRYTLLKEWVPQGPATGDKGFESDMRGVGPGLHGNLWCGFVALKFER